MLEATFAIISGESEWGNITGNIQEQTDLQDELSSITGGLSEDINALDNKYDSITGALNDSIVAVDNKYDSITGALGDSITAVDNKFDSITGGLDNKIDNHIANISNPHSVTKAQVGLGNCDNTSDLNKPVSTAQQTALDGKVDKNSAITGSTKCKITYDAKGLVTGGANLSASDIPNLTLSKITDVTASATELNYVDGVTSAIQTQLNNKLQSEQYGTIIINI